MTTVPHGNIAESMGKTIVRRTIWARAVVVLVIAFAISGAWFGIVMWRTGDEAPILPHGTPWTDEIGLTFQVESMTVVKNVRKGNLTLSAEEGTVYLRVDMRVMNVRPMETLRSHCRFHLVGMRQQTWEGDSTLMNLCDGDPEASSIQSGELYYLIPERKIPDVLGVQQRSSTMRFIKNPILSPPN